MSVMISDVCITKTIWFSLRVFTKCYVVLVFTFDFREKRCAQRIFSKKNYSSVASSVHCSKQTKLARTTKFGRTEVFDELQVALSLLSVDLLSRESRNC